MTPTDDNPRHDDELGDLHDLDPRGTMSFGDHLDELRRRIIVSVIAVAAIFIVLFFVRNTIMAIVLHPVRKALIEQGVIERAAEDDAAHDGEDRNSDPHRSDAGSDDEESRSRMSLDLFGVRVFEWTITTPPPAVEPTGQGPGRAPPHAQSNQTVYAKSPIDGVITLFKILAIVALFLSAPIVGSQLWAFVAAGLYPRERRVVYFFAPLTIGLFMAGVVFCYFVMLHFALPYLFGFVMEFAGLVLFVNETAMFVIHICLVMGLVFQIPLVILFLVKSRLLSVARIVHYRRHCYMVTIVVGAMLTPPDVVTQLLMAGPMILLFEFGVLLGRWAERTRRREEKA